MGNKLNTLFIICILFITPIVVAQNIEFGVDKGYSLYFGDLTPSGSTFSFTRSRSVTGYRLGYGNEKGTVYLSYMNTVLGADDKNATSEGRRDRDLNFETDISEWGFAAELNLLSILLKRDTKIQPTFTTGINVFSFKPFTKIGNSLIELRPLTIEDNNYNLNQISIPIGIGIRYNAFSKLWIGTGIKARLTFTDYIDDVSIRGNSDKGDWYMTTYITIGYKLYSVKRNCIKCPFEY
jgi:hypothetical protein